MKRDPDLEDQDEIEIEEELDDEIGLDDSTQAGLLGFLAGLIVGAVFGAGAMLFAAPERGSVTRRKVRRRLEDIGEDATDELQRHRRRLQKRLKRGFRKR